MKISKIEGAKYSKQIILKDVGIIGQKKILSSKVLVVGVGGLGCPLLLYLSNLGIKNLGIADYDKIELSNLNRQVLFNYGDIGKFKSIQAKKILKKINSKAKIFVYKKKINKKNIHLIAKKFDIICDCSDNFNTRYIINDYCLKNKKILISAAINKYEGQIFNFNFKKKVPCFRCFMPEVPEQDNNCDTDGLMPTVAGLAGIIQANEVVKSILNHKNTLVGKMIIFNTLNLNFRITKLSKSLDCVSECKKR